MRSKIFFSFLVHISPALCQFAMNGDMKADVTFGDHNDRFDISNLVQEQRHFEDYLSKNRRHRFKKDKAGAEERSPGSSEEVRRSFRYPGKLFARRWDGGFAYHDDMRSDIGGSLEDYEKALDKFRTSKYRRYQGLDTFDLGARRVLKALQERLDKKNTLSLNPVRFIQQRFARGYRRNDDQALRYEIPQGLKITTFERQ